MDAPPPARRLDHSIAFNAGAELGLLLKQVNEWAIVLATPNRWESKVRVGDVLSAVDGRPVLLEDYEVMFQLVVEAKLRRTPYTLTFRRAPFHRGWLQCHTKGASIVLQL